MLRILHMADLHLGWEPGYLPDDKKNIRRRERDKILEKAVDFALKPENNIQAVLLVGDLFEKYAPEKSLVKVVLKQLNRLKEAGLFLVTVPGNHDEITYRESVYRNYGDEWPGILVRNPMPELVVSKNINGINIHIYSLAYTGGLTRPNAIDSFPRKDEPGLHIGAFHGSLDWQKLADRSLPLDSSLLAKAGYDYIALGHYHRHLEEKIGKGKAVYPGSIEFKSFHDTGTGHFTVMEYSGNRINVEKYPVDRRKHLVRVIPLSGMADWEELIESCRKLSDPQAMVHLKLSGNPRFAIDTEKLAEELEPYFFYLEIDNSARFFAESFLKSIAQEPTVRGAYVRRFQEKQKEAASEREQKVLERALLKGLTALEGGEK